MLLEINKSTNTGSIQLSKKTNHVTKDIKETDKQNIIPESFSRKTPVGKLEAIEATIKALISQNQ